MFVDPALSLDAFTINEAVEIQWKQQPSYPFGWWYGKIVNIERRDSGSGDICLNFEQYYPNSPWYQVFCRFENGHPVQHMNNGGFVGGIRKIDQPQCDKWNQFMPENKL